MYTTYRFRNEAITLLLSAFALTSTGFKGAVADIYQPPVPDTLYSYSNPLSEITGIGDPYVLHHGEKYYMYATSSPQGFQVWESENMIDWNLKGMALNRNSEGNKWGTGNFWAPEVKYYRGKFYMTYSAKETNDVMKIRIARSDSPLGPFINWSEPFCRKDTFSYIDGSLFTDDDRVYLFYVRDCSRNVIQGKHVSQIYVTRLNEDLTAFEGSPRLILTPDQDWEGINKKWMWNEGPFVMKHQGTLYLFYSANVFNSPEYSVGVAMAKSPMGDWKKYSHNPVLKKDTAQRISGPGHCMITTSPDSTEFFMVYHTHTFFDKPGGNRNLCIDRLVFEDGIPKVIGPTRSPQSLPSGVKYWFRN